MKIFPMSLLMLLLSISGSEASVLSVGQNEMYKTINSAIENAVSNDTILIHEGVYNEYNLVVKQAISIIGKGTVIIDGQNKGEILTIKSDSVKIEGLEIINVGTSYTVDFAAIRIVKSKQFIIRDVSLRQLFFGIYLEKSGHGIIENNTISGVAKDEYNSGNGIHLWYSHNVVVRNNTVSGVRDGIYLEFSDSITIEGNTSRNNLRYGLHFMFSDDDTYTNNTFEQNGAGVAVMFSRRIIMEENTFINNWGSSSYGLLLKEISDAEIINNHFSNNTIAINIEGSNRINYKKNKFISNGWAIKILGACYENTFTDNDFLSNSFDVSFNTQMNDNLFSQNYWSEYAGYDLNKDGYGDVPYRPVKLFSYIVNRCPETIVLLRSLFMSIIDFSEKVSPVFTPDELVDASPRMKPML